MELVLGLALVAGLVWLAVHQSSAQKRQAKAPPVVDVRRNQTRWSEIDQIVRQQRSEADREAARILAEIEAAVQQEVRDWPERPMDPTPVGRSRTAAKTDHHPPRPAGQTVSAWSPRNRHLEVAGEWYRADNLRRLVRKHDRLTEHGTEIKLPAVLVPDPSNPHDANAVAVYVDGLHVGYMERADAKHYHQALAALVPANLAVPSRQWVSVSRNDTWARVTLSIPDIAGLTCPSELSPDAAILPAGSTIQVTREDQHLEHLAPLLAAYGTETVVAATLSTAMEQRPRSTVELIAVAIDGARVGVLTPTQTANLLPVVRRAEELDRTPTCRALLRGNSLKVDVALLVRKTHELSEEELQLILGEGA